MATDTLPFVSVVVPVHNAERTLTDCLRSLLRVDYPESRREILVVDNASTDASASIMRRFPVIRVFEPRPGPSHARNRGLTASRGAIVAFTDADCIVTTRWLRSLVWAFSEADVSAVAGEILPYPPHSWAEYYMARRQSHWQRAALAAARPYIVTANIGVRRATFDRIGPFDPRFIIGQDQDFSWRLFAAGLRVHYAPEALVFHRHRRTTWQFVRQQAGWARGAVLLRRYHGVPWAVRDELAEYRVLVRACGRLLVAAGRAVRGGGRADVAYHFHDVLREVSRRATMLRMYVLERTPRRFAAMPARAVVARISGISSGAGLSQS